MASIGERSQPVGKGETNRWTTFASMWLARGIDGACCAASAFVLPKNYVPGNAAEAPVQIKNAQVFGETKILNEGAGFLPSVVQAGGSVSITAGNKISNGVERSNTANTGAGTRGFDTSAGGTGGSSVIILNKQLPPIWPSNR